MPLHDLQKYLEAHIPGACLPVDLLKIAKSVGCRRYVPKGPNRSLHGPTNSLLTLVVDGECCLDRLYGGFFSDWVCGGQWNRMVQFLAVLIQTIQNNNIELAVFFNGALEQQRLGEWAQKQAVRRKHINSVLRHVSVKGTPPPKVWWVAPTGLRMSLRMALRHLGIQVISTMDDHHQEVIAFCRENNYHGLMAEDAEYIIFDPPRYFSSHQLKLTYKGSLETKEFILDEIAKGLNLPRNYFCFLATLLGNYLLSEDDLHDFYGTLIPGYDKNQNTEEELIRAVVKFITNNCDVNNLLTIGAQIFGSVSDPRVTKFKESVQYFLNGTKDGFLRYKPLPPGRRDISMPSHFKQHDVQGNSILKCDSKEGHKSFKEADEDFCPQINHIQIKLPPVPHEVMRTASERHQKGLMYPWIYQVLNHGEVKFEPSVQDENCSEFPNSVHFFQPIRQYIYAILFNLHHHTYMARKSKEDGQKATQAPDIKIKEWVYSKTNPYKTPLLVEAVPISWAVPTVQRLWFGSIIDDKKRRLRAFLSCVLSDSPLMLHTSYVPQHLLIMAVVLRYIMNFNEVAILRKQEVDAFLVTAFSPELTNAQYLQELQIPVVSSRGVQLASFFMVGVENALFANDACGSPIPWLMCCPWLFFDGKLFHSYLTKANCSRNLMELCDGDIELVRKVERCRHAILEGLHLNFLQTPPVPLPGNSSMPPPTSLGLSNSPVSYPGNGSVNANGGNSSSTNASRGRSRGRGLSNGSGASSSTNNGNHLYSRGGQLQVAGVVVGSWGPNYGRTNPKNSNNGYGSGMTDMYSGRPGHNGTIRNSRTPASRGRPSVLAKRKTIKRKEVRPIQRGKSQQPSPYSAAGYSHSETEIGNGVCDTSQLTQASNYSAYTNTSYSSYSTNSAYHHNYHPEMAPPNPEPINLAPFHPHNQSHHHHNPYGTHSSGLKSPDSGVNVSILE
ncbi:UNVERIFIED_CONTAM: hypothetical protein RMT77_005486 [Armadillidium vulgare]